VKINNFEIQVKKNVLIVIPVLLIGGTERQTLTLVKALIEGGYGVTVCCYYEYESMMTSQMKETGAEVILMGMQRSYGLVHLYKGLRAILKDLLPDIVHVQYIAPGLIPVLAAKLAGIRTIFATVHQPGRVYGWKEKTLLRIAARICTAFFCNSKAVEESWFGDSEIFDPNKQYKNRKHFTIYNAVDIDYIEEITKKADRNKLKHELGINHRPIVGVVGRLRWEKGQDILLYAMPEVIKAIPNVILLVVGDGPDRGNLRVKAKELGIESHIIWLGQIDYEKVVKFNTIMDVVVVPSRFEGFGLSAAEAMAVGCPVVCSQVDGLTEIIENGLMGYLFPVGDSKRLAIILIDVLCNKHKTSDLMERGKEYISNNFSTEKFTLSTISAYLYFCK